jgi:hypothetical protein
MRKGRSLARQVNTHRQRRNSPGTLSVTGAQIMLDGSAG